MQVRNIRFPAVNLNGILFKGPSHGCADNIDDAGFGDEAIAGVEAPRVAVPAQQGIVGEMIGFEGELSVGGSFHGGVDEMRLPETKTFSHGNRYWQDSYLVDSPAILRETASAVREPGGGGGGKTHAAIRVAVLFR